MRTTSKPHKRCLQICTLLNERFEALHLLRANLRNPVGIALPRLQEALEGRMRSWTSWLSVNIRSSIEKNFQNLITVLPNLWLGEIPLTSLCAMQQRIFKISVYPRRRFVHVCPSVDQQADDLWLVPVHSLENRLPHRAWFAVYICSLGPQQGLNCVHTPVLDRIVQR